MENNTPRSLTVAFLVSLALLAGCRTANDTDKTTASTGSTTATVRRASLGAESLPLYLGIGPVTKVGYQWEADLYVTNTVPGRTYALRYKQRMTNAVWGTYVFLTGASNSPTVYHYRHSFPEVYFRAQEYYAGDAINTDEIAAWSSVAAQQAPSLALDSAKRISVEELRRRIQAHKKKG